MAACAPSWIGCASALPDRRANLMGISSDEISSLIKRRIKEFDVPILAADVGIVTEVGDGIAQIYGLQSAQALELLEFKGGVSGIALNLEEDSVGAVILGPYEDIKEGDQVRTTGKIIQVPVGEALVGRVVNALGEPIDGKGPIETKEFAPVEKVAPGVITRQPVDTPLQTGIKAIDAMIPIGRGQRELIIGDRQTGKTAIALDTIINQKGQGVICIYVAIGQRAATVAQVAATSRRAARWSTRSSFRPPPASPPRCGTSRPTPVARWASTSWTRERTRCSCTTTFPSTPGRTVRF